MRVTSGPERARLLVVGGGPTGAAAARAFCEESGDGGVVILSADSAMPYERPPLSKDFLRGEVQAVDIGIEDADFYPEHGITVWLRTRVASLDPSGHAVALVDGSAVAYDACVLATGAEPSRLQVPGADDRRVLRLRSLDDARRLVAAASTARSAVVVGSGFIGCEVAASLAARGLDVTMVAREECPQGKRLGPDVGDRIGRWLRADGVEIITDAAVEAIDDARTVRLANGAAVTGDLVLTAVGVRPSADLAEGAGLAVRDGRVLVDQRMRTSAPDLLAAGDVALAHNGAAGRRLAVEHWGEAQEMGRVAGANAAGAGEAWTQAPGFWSTIGGRTLKYVAWGDGFDEVRVRTYGPAFTAWYGSDGVTVGVLTHERDDDYERGRDLVESGAPLP